MAIADYTLCFKEKAGKLIIRKADGTVEEKPAMTRAEVEKIVYKK